MIGRRSSKTFVAELGAVLSRQPKTQAEIVEQLDGIDRGSLKDWLDVLCHIGYAIETDTGYRIRHRHSDRQVALQVRNILNELHEGREVVAYTETEKLLEMIEDQPDQFDQDAHDELLEEYGTGGSGD